MVVKITRRFSSGILKMFLERLQAFDHEAAAFSFSGNTSMRPALALDLRPCRLADGVHAHGQRVGHIAVAQQLDAAAVGPLDEPGAREAVGIHGGSRGERAQRLEIHHRVLGLAAVGQEAALGDAAIERHLAALEAGRRSAARARLLALLALGRRLAVARRPARGRRACGA
jgi:hypothetical protein